MLKYLIPANTKFTAVVEPCCTMCCTAVLQVCVHTHVCMCRVYTHTHLRASVQGGYANRSWTFVQLLFTTFLHGYLDSQVSRPIDGNKRRFPRRPVSRILSLEPELFTVDSSRRPSREARARAQAPRARVACNFSKY